MQLPQSCGRLILPGPLQLLELSPPKPCNPHPFPTVHHFCDCSYLVAGQEATQWDAPAAGVEAGGEWSAAAEPAGAQGGDWGAAEAPEAAAAATEAKAGDWGASAEAPAAATGDWNAAGEEESKDFGANY